ncbi:PssE/Cps14G family polysaccharide biosynthesis glycosyltransferase [Romboutsia timonensis]|uniref:PssE/Cps14G family polysaccharide biosynthesis glycosyltransferase n=1 Tax=Romboutsia timonensis TaxID=1776391 RepID=UPI002A7EB377|nr:PssE/Cps14G family polysaccharide biosynthesis glycosyltransferase [Romboutsia timonensis]MDY3959625.1 PssE/Cps14G family polysaccharide biosynthesis glycosyltransferase [Romboutsia timonensis]
MIFVTLGSQKFQFNRILKEIDRLIEEGKITEEVFAQIGYSDYKPKNYNYKEFLDRDEFNNMMSKCDKVITHGGTGAIIGAVKNRKKVIAVPRLSKFGEHVDDHQIQIVEEFHRMKFILSVKNMQELEKNIYKLNDFKPKEYVSNTRKIIQSIELYIS